MDWEARTVFFELRGEDGSVARSVIVALDAPRARGD